MRRWFRISAVGMVLVTMSSCSLIRRGGRQAKPPVIAAPPTLPPAKPVENPQVPPPPKVEQATTPPAKAPNVSSQIPAQQPPPSLPSKKPPKPPKRPNVTAAGAKVIATPGPVSVTAGGPPAAAEQANGAGATAAAASQPATSAPPVENVLAPLMSAAQQEAHNKAIDTALATAEANLASVASKKLNDAQRANAERARSFIAQAQQVRGSDLVTAKSFADRAVVLAQALVSEVP